MKNVTSTWITSKNSYLFLFYYIIKKVFILMEIYESIPELYEYIPVHLQFKESNFLESLIKRKVKSLMSSCCLIRMVSSFKIKSTARVINRIDHENYRIISSRIVIHVLIGSLFQLYRHNHIPFTYVVNIYQCFKEIMLSKLVQL